MTRFVVEGSGILYDMDDLEALQSSDKLAILGENGRWWTAEVRTAPRTARVVSIVPARAFMPVDGEEREVVIEVLIIEESKSSRLARVRPRRPD